MPIKEGIDNIGRYFQYGSKGKKYYFTDEKSKIIAYNLVLKQAKAIHANKKK